MCAEARGPEGGSGTPEAEVRKKYRPLAALGREMAPCSAFSRSPFRLSRLQHDKHARVSNTGQRVRAGVGSGRVKKVQRGKKYTDILVI